MPRICDLCQKSVINLRRHNYSCHGGVPRSAAPVPLASAAPPEDILFAAEDDILLAPGYDNDDVEMRGDDPVVGAALDPEADSSDSEAEEAVAGIEEIVLDAPDEEDPPPPPSVRRVPPRGRKCALRGTTMG
jgi:hypothetical protein